MASPVLARWLVLMAKEPKAGAVKTRLAAEIGAAAAAGFYRLMVGNVARRLARDPRWRTVLAVAPDTSRHAHLWPAGIARIAQGQGSLGARMQRIMDGMPPGPVVIVGTDIPGVRPGHIARAFTLLGRNDAVLGPAPDGGYWLVGLRRSPKVLSPFRGVRWSGPHSMADTRGQLDGAVVALADRLCDVDDAAGYRRLKGAGSRIVMPYGARFAD